MHDLMHIFMTVSGDLSILLIVYSLGGIILILKLILIGDYILTFGLQVDCCTIKVGNVPRLSSVMAEDVG